MSVGERLREERTRLGYSQPTFAGLASATKSAIVKWEKDTSSPNALALAAWAEVGADVLYILTGQRTAERPDNAASQIEEQLAEIRREILDPARTRLPTQDEQQAAEQTMKEAANALKAMLRYDRPLMPEALSAEVEQMLDIVENPASLSLFRAADRVQLRKRREAVRADLREWLEGSGYQPDEAVTYLLVTLAVEYGAPVKLLSELVYEMRRDMSGATASD